MGSYPIVIGSRWSKGQKKRRWWSCVGQIVLLYFNHLNKYNLILEINLLRYSRWHRRRFSSSELRPFESHRERNLRNGVSYCGPAYEHLHQRPKRWKYLPWWFRWPFGCWTGREKCFSNICLRFPTTIYTYIQNCVSSFFKILAVTVRIVVCEICWVLWVRTPHGTKLWLFYKLFMNIF